MTLTEQYTTLQLKGAREIAVLMAAMVTEAAECREAMDEQAQPDGSSVVALEDYYRTITGLQSILSQILDNSRSSVVDTYEQLDEEVREMVDDQAPSFIEWTER